MSDFLNRLVSRSLGLSQVAAQVAQPLVPSRVFARTEPVQPDRGREGVGELGLEMAFGSVEPVAERQDAARVRRRVSPEGQVDPPAMPAVPAMFAEPAAGSVAQAIPARNPAEPVRRTATGNAESMDDASGVRDPASTIPLAAGLPARQVNQLAERRPNPESAAPPVIRVTIGRVDIRAEFPAPVTAQPAPARSKSSAMSLSEYLKQRSEGRR